MSITTLDPSMLENKFERDSLVPGFYKAMKKIADLSNQNLVRNSDAYISNGGKVDSEKSLCGLTILLRKEHQNFN